MVKVNTGPRWWIPISIIAGLAMIAGAWWYVTQPNLATFTYTRIGLSLEYDADALQVQDVEPAEENGNIFARIQQIEGAEPEILISFRTQTGLSVASGVTGQTPVELVSEAILRSYPDQFPQLSEVVERSVTIDELQAFRYVFTYIGPVGEPIQQVTYAIGLNPDEVLLINMQTLQSEFDSVNQTHFEPIIDSIQL